ncbi:hypothetical protein DCAR_0623426 [Daucus carota subsp. sativus]|uniref:Uncharacterized protein n=1 Tax=Daucus carota subsp. sativus TaxID=79200 RepID=A0A161ZVP5_DAUCS|nr:hypothetical protein DCAR_0623426 [Daucus carota subsp. sativus]
MESHRKTSISQHLAATEVANQEKEENKSAKKLIKKRQDSVISQPKEDDDIGSADADNSALASDHSGGQAKDKNDRRKQEAREAVLPDEI